jgi:FAD/FMN-containing dehydrogenase
MARERPVSREAIETLRATLAGELLRPGEAGYDEARSVWNSRFDRRPDLVARCCSTGDVSAAVSFAREHGLLLSVRGGGHDYAGNTVGDGGLLVDLSPMKTVTVDANARRARAEAGATWSDLDAATQAHGLATPGGTVSSVGIAGFTLGGGQGWLTRKFGLAADNLVAADVVTASGDVVRASAEDNADLYWAIRGGGGNFGIASGFEYELHEVGPEILAGQVLYPLERAAELVRWYRDHMRTAPDEVAAYVFFVRIPPLPDFPAEMRGKVVLDFAIAYAGPPDSGERHLAPFRQHGNAFMDTVARVPYVALQQAFDAGMAAGNRWYSRYLQLTELSDACIDTLLAGLDPFPGPMTAVYLGGQGGAPNRVPADATAYPHRNVAEALHIFPGWIDAGEDRSVMAWARGLYEALAPFAENGAYVNMLAEDETSRLRSAYKNNYARLVATKRKWDPDNLFRMNRNIAPAG